MNEICEGKSFRRSVLVSAAQKGEERENRECPAGNRRENPLELIPSSTDTTGHSPAGLSSAAFGCPGRLEILRACESCEPAQFDCRWFMFWGELKCFCVRGCAALPLLVGKEQRLRELQALSVCPCLPKKVQSSLDMPHLHLPAPTLSFKLPVPALGIPQDANC